MTTSTALDPKLIAAALELLRRGRYQLLKPHPHISYSVLKMEFVADPSCQTLYTNGQVVGYNPDYVLKLKGPDRKGQHQENFQYAVSEVTHEGLHALLGHCKDWKAIAGLDPVEVNKAQDYAINLIVHDMGLPIHPSWLFDEKYRGMHWREILDAMPKDPNKKSNCKVLAQPCEGGAGGPGEGQDEGGTSPAPAPAKGPIVADGSGTPPTVPGQKHNAWDKIAVEAAKFADSIGTCPGYLKDFVTEITKPSVDYKHVLARYMSKVKRDSYSFRRPNKRYISTGMVFPTLTGYTADCLIYVDTSGSTWGFLQRFWGEIEGVVRAVGVPVDVMMGDTEMAAVKRLRRPGDVKLLEKAGGGGTDFKFVFDYVAKGYTVADPAAKGKELKRVHKPEVLFFFTDGEGEYPDQRPSYPVIWLIPEAAKLKGSTYYPPFGRVIDLPWKR